MRAEGFSEVSETTTAVLTQLSHPEREALRRFIRKDRPELSEGEAVRLLTRDALIGLGELSAKSSG